MRPFAMHGIGKLCTGRRRSLWIEYRGRWLPWAPRVVRLVLEEQLMAWGRAAPPTDARLPIPRALDINLPRVFWTRKWGTRWAHAKEGVQDVMFAHADRHQHTFWMVHASPSGRGYGSYPSVHAFLDNYPDKIPQSERYFYEIVRPATPVRIFMDIEFYQDDRDDAEAEDVLERILGAATELTVARTQQILRVSDWAVADNCRADGGQWKVSFHANLTDIYYADIRSGLHEWGQALAARLPEDIAARGAFDKGVYTPNRSWRLPFSGKTRSGRIPLRPRGDRPIHDFIVTYPPDPSTCTVIGSSVDPEPARTRRVRTAKPPCAGHSTEKFTSLIRKAGDATGVLTGTRHIDANTFIIYGRTVGGSRTCPSGHTHHSNNFFLRVHDTRVYYKCLGEQPCAKRGLYIGRVEE